MEEESILKKMERLFKMRRLLKEKKLKRIKDKKLKYGRWDLDDEDDDYDYEDELLSRPELIEEALKEYMYQFGLSIYQNKQGDYYFKRFADDIDIRGFDELDTHHFALREKEPNFFERLLEVVPENKIHLTGDMETAVFDLYEKDAVMTDILDQMVEEETLKCREILKATEDVYETVDQTRADEFSRTDALANEEFVPGLDGLAAENGKARTEDFYEDGKPVAAGSTDSDAGTPVSPAGEQWKAYECGGEERVEKARLPKPAKVRRVRKPQTSSLPAGMVKDNGNNR